MMALIQIVSFLVRWLGAFVLAVVVMVVAMLAIAVVPGLLVTPAPEETLEFAQSWTALFWFALFLAPLVAGIALPFAVGFSFLAEINGIEIHAVRYGVMGAGAGLIVGWLTTAQIWAGSPPIDFAIAGALGGFVLGALHWGRFELVPRRKAPEHEL